MASEESIASSLNHTLLSPVLVHSKPSLSCAQRHQRHPSLDLLGHAVPGMAHPVTPPPSASTTHQRHLHRHQRNLSLDSAMRALNPPSHSAGGDTADRRSLASDDSGIFNSDDGDRTARVIADVVALPAVPPCPLTLRPPVPGVIDEVHSPTSPQRVGPEFPFQVRRCFQVKHPVSLTSQRTKYHTHTGIWDKHTMYTLLYSQLYFIFHLCFLHLLKSFGVSVVCMLYVCPKY